MSDKPGTEERYSSANNATSLVVVAERRGPADVLIAAGWSPSRVGTALMRLASEWDSSEKPRRADAELINQIATTPGEDGRPIGNRRARDLAAVWLHHERGILFGKLKTLPTVRALLTRHAEVRQMVDPATVAMNTLMWWLDKTCPECLGHGRTLIPGTPSLSAHKCPVCRGSGNKPLLHGQDGRKMLNYIEGCKHDATQQIGSRLRTINNYRITVVDSREEWEKTNGGCKS